MMTDPAGKPVNASAEAGPGRLADDRRADEPKMGREARLMLSELEELRARCAALSSRNAELELRLGSATGEVEALRSSTSGEVAELRHRLKTTSEHLDLADRRVTTLREELTQHTANSTRLTGRLEEQLRDREAAFE